MKKHIAEELPARKHAPAEAPSSEKGGGEVKKKAVKLQKKELSKQYMIFVTEHEEKNFLFVRHIRNICKIVV
jgi:hypothetical protein